MLAELEHYRPPAHKAHLEAIREACWGHRHGPPADAAVAGHVEARRPGARPGSYGAPPTDAAAPSAEPHPHAVRAAVRASGDRATVLAFNACCEAVWAFRAVHTAYADLCACGGGVAAMGVGGVGWGYGRGIDGLPHSAFLFGLLGPNDALSASGCDDDAAARNSSPFPPFRAADIGRVTTCEIATGGTPYK